MLTDLHPPAPGNTAPRDGSNPPVVATPDPDPLAAAQLKVVTESCGTYALESRTKLFVTGEDRTRWLNGMITNNIRDLAEDHGVYAFLLNAQGRIQGDLYAFNRGKAIVLDIDRAQVEKLLAIFEHYIVMDDVQIERADDRLVAVGLQGPNAAAVLVGAGIQVPVLEPLQIADLTWQGGAITVLRAEAWKGDAYELWLAPDRVQALQESLHQAGAIPVGPAAQNLYRIAAGIPLFGEDIRERDLPQETGQERALHFAKGCYVGQEIVERIRSRGQVHRVFTGFDLTAAAAPGDAIETQTESSAKAVGEITSTANIVSPAGNRLIALGYLRREAFAKPLTIHGAPVHRCELPFRELLQP